MTPTLEERDMRMRRMIRRLRVDVLELAYADVGSVYCAARRACLECRSATTCRLWLESEDAASPSFCPNLDRFAHFSAHQALLRA